MKINIIKATCLSICFMLVSCIEKPKKSIQEAYAEELVERYVSDMEKEYHLHHTSMLWQMYGGIVNLLGPRFGTYKKLDISRARQLTVELANELIKRINDSEKLRPYLKNYPFTIENVLIGLGYNGKNSNEENELNYIFIKNGIIYYESKDKKTDKYYNVHQESYEEATQNLKSKKLCS